MTRAVVARRTARAASGRAGSRREAGPPRRAGAPLLHLLGRHAARGQSPGAHRPVPTLAGRPGALPRRAVALRTRFPLRPGLALRTLAPGRALALRPGLALRTRLPLRAAFA